jgi:hypothetical protein
MFFVIGAGAYLSVTRLIGRVGTSPPRLLSLALFLMRKKTPTKINTSTTAQTPPMMPNVVLELSISVGEVAVTSTIVNEAIVEGVDVELAGELVVSAAVSATLVDEDAVIVLSRFVEVDKGHSGSVDRTEQRHEAGAVAQSTHVSSNRHVVSLKAGDDGTRIWPVINVSKK